jgi:hypothetical protein
MHLNVRSSPAPARRHFTMTRNYSEEIMRFTASLGLLAAFCIASVPAAVHAQQSADSSATVSGQRANPLPAAADLPQIPNGTRVLIALEADMSTKDAKPGQDFRAHTIEPIVTPDGRVLPIGTDVRGHVSRVEAGAKTGRARLWLSFDDMETPAGRMPLIAEVTQVPGELAVKPGENKEGEIEARTSTDSRVMQATATGAAIGAAPGAMKGDTKAAAMGAAAGGFSGFLAASGFGQELSLPKGTKLEIQLLRPVYLARR